MRARSGGVFVVPYQALWGCLAGRAYSWSVWCGRGARVSLVVHVFPSAGLVVKNPNLPGPSSSLICAGAWTAWPSSLDRGAAERRRVPYTNPLQMVKVQWEPA